MQKSQIKAWRASVRLWKHSAPYNPLISISSGKWFYQMNFFWLAKSCDKITSLGLYYVSKGLKALDSLQSIHLSFYESVTFARWVFWLAKSCRKITDPGLKSLGETLKTLRSLQSINLNFREWVTFGKYELADLRIAATNSQIKV